MSDSLEDFIRNNKSEFNSQEPPMDLWEKINKQLEADQQKKTKIIRLSKRNNYLKIAVILAFFVTSGILIWKHQRQDKIDLASINPNLARQQMHYASLVTEKQSELEEIKNANPQLYSEFSSELEKIENNYKKLQSGLAASPNQEVTVKAMIRNLQVQIQVLNQQLTIIRQIDQFKKEQHHETQQI